MTEFKKQPIEYTREMDMWLMRYCNRNSLTIKELMNKSWLSESTIFWARRRKIIWANTLKKLESSTGIKLY